LAPIHHGRVLGQADGVPGRCVAAPAAGPPRPVSEATLTTEPEPEPASSISGTTARSDVVFGGGGSGAAGDNTGDDESE
jgi:hypothetical protein